MDRHFEEQMVVTFVYIDVDDSWNGFRIISAPNSGNGYHSDGGNDGISNGIGYDVSDGTYDGIWDGSYDIVIKHASKSQRKSRFYAKRPGTNCFRFEW